MSSRSITRAVIKSPWRSPPVFLLPLRARLSTTTTTTTQPADRESRSSSTSSYIPSRRSYATSSDSLKAATSKQSIPPSDAVPPATPELIAAAAAIAAETSTVTATSPAPSQAVSGHGGVNSGEPLSESVASLLPLLVSQRPHYATVHVHGRAYLVTEGDVVRLPFVMGGVNPGDIIRLDRASLIGSRDFTLKGQPYVDARLFECRATVLSVEAEPMRFEEKTKRRNRRVKTVKSKHRYTEIAIGQLRVKDVGEIE